jgi:penicillin amidase
MTSSLGSLVVRFINILIAVVLVVALAAVYWFGWRPLPQRSGSIAAPVGAPVAVRFDSLGVPHIRAANLDDALFVQGYVTAQDRLFQMELLRRFNGGDLAEVFGRIAIESDRESRRLRLRRIAENAYGTLPASDRAAFAAYARGVNEFISTHRGNLPLEYRMAGFEPRPWSVVDSLLICLHMLRSLTTTWRDELLKYEMMAGGHPDRVNYLFPVRSGRDEQPGSNAWAIAGSLTESGKPLLSNDMHLEYSLPGIWYMTHLEAPDLDVSGVALPGAPGIIVGHNRRIAWGITNLGYDVQDLWMEKFDPRSGRYMFHGQPGVARLEREIIRVKGQGPVEVATWVTPHGPLFAGDGEQRMVLRWIAFEPGMIQYPILQINQARNWQEFNAAISRFAGPGSNFVYADVDGNIGYHAVGKLPKRRGYVGDLPVDVSEGDSDWDGFIPFEELPSAFNPPGGLIVTGNQNPFPPDYPYTVNGNFFPPYRASQIRQLLSARKGWRAADLLAVQKDVYSSFHRFLAQQAVAAYEKRQAKDPRLDAAAAMLRSWNGQVEAGLGAPFLAELLYQQIRTAMAEAAAPGKGAAYSFTGAPTAVENLLRERPPGWFQDYDEMLLRAFVDAVEEGSRIQGRDSGRWKYGEYLRVTITHPVVHELPWIGRYFDIGPVRMSGGSSTVKQTTMRLAPSMRMDADLADWDRSLLNIPIGQSGQILSSHYRDQWPEYFNGRSFPMQFDRVESKSNLEFRPR